jgi:hypothetical protein
VFQVKQEAGQSMKFGRKKRETAPPEPFDYSLLPELEPAALEDQVSEGMMLAQFAGRMALKNQIVIGTLTDPAPYDAERYRDAARAVLEEQASESDESARLAEAERMTATGRQGMGQHQHDYRESDTANLLRRQRVHTTVAERLRAMKDDPEYLAGFIERARDDAWGDIAGAITARLDREWPAFAGGPDGETGEPGDSPRKQRKRTRQLQKDLAKLAHEHDRS